MNKIKLLVAAALLAVLGSATSGAPGPIANPAIYGEWRLDFTVDSSGLPTAKGGDCVFTGDMELTINPPALPKEDANKVSDPVFGQARMQLVSGDCGDFLADISGNAFGNNIFFVMAVFPVMAEKDAEKGPIFGIVFEGELIDASLMEGDITGFVAKGEKGVFGTWRATRGGIVPAITPAGILLLLAGLGLAGGMALRRRR